MTTVNEYLVVFDLDGTLLREYTVCELLAEGLGRLDRMSKLEQATSLAQVRAARYEMLEWYRDVPTEFLVGLLANAKFAPGTEEALARLHGRGVLVAIASLTWKFAVEWLAKQLNIVHCLGTELSSTGDISHVWPRDKATWARRLAEQYQIPIERTAAVGDSLWDVEMLSAVGHAVFVGAEIPSKLESTLHIPNANLQEVVSWILDAFGFSV